MRIVVLTTRQPHQVALVAKLRNQCDVVAVVASRNAASHPSVRAQRPLLNRIASRTIGRPFVVAWFEMLRHYEQGFGRDFSHDFPVIEVGEVNAPATVELLRSSNPDLVVVSGTNLVKAEVMNAMAGQGGIVNLHTGISPFVKGAPNCTNWCLAKGWFSLIGNTVMWLDPGIDSGAIIATERTPLDGTENLTALHWKVMEHAHDLLLRSVALLAAGKPVPRVPQESIGPGVTFYSRQWGAMEMLRARMNFSRCYAGAIPAAADEKLTLVEI